jgi:arsenate reductase
MARMATDERRILFVCRHGAAKSVLAASLTRGAARSRGLDLRASARGVEPQERMSTALVSLLPEEEEGLAAARPRRVTAEDVASAWRVVTFNVDPGELPGTPNGHERWDDVPSVADDPAGARAAIERHVAELLNDAH